MNEFPVDTSPVDTITTQVQVTVTTVRNSASFIESEVFNIGNNIMTPTKMYNTAYMGRNSADRMVNELAAPLGDAIARQIGNACETSHEETGEVNE